MTHHRIVTTPVTLVAALMSGSCAFLTIGAVCAPDGKCVLAPVIRGVICPDGRPAPTASECSSAQNFTPQDMAGLELTVSAPYGVTYTKTSGSVAVIIGGGPTLNAQWIVQNSKIVLSDATSVGNWIVTNTPGTQTYSVEFDFDDVKVTAPGNSANQTVQLTTKVRHNGATLQTVTNSYVYYPPPPTASISLEFVRDCNWLVTSQLSNPAYVFVIERQFLSGGAWSQTYSGLDTCAARTGSFRYRGLYKDPFGNRGTESPVWTSYCF